MTTQATSFNSRKVSTNMTTIDQNQDKSKSDETCPCCKEKLVSNPQERYCDNVECDLHLLPQLKNVDHEQHFD